MMRASQGTRTAVGMGLLVAAMTAVAYGQDKNQPNAQPNPYRMMENFVQLPPGMEWPGGAPAGTPFAGQVVGIDLDAQGNFIVLRRADPPILKFDPSGR